MKLTDEEIKRNEERLKQLLLSTNREGMDKVIAYLQDNDYFLIPSSLHRHHNWKGGLAQHCLGVFDRLCQTGENLPLDSRIIVSCLHDICKARKFYFDSEGNPHELPEEQLHIPGHGKRSIKILEMLGLKLTPEEKAAIRWHMGGYNLPKEEIRDFFATKGSDLWRLHHNADRYDASHNPAI